MTSDNTTKHNTTKCKPILSRTFCKAAQPNLQTQRRKLIYCPRTDAYLIFTSLYQAFELSTLSLLYIVYRFNMPEISITWLINIHRERGAWWPSATKLVLFFRCHVFVHNEITPVLWYRRYFFRCYVFVHNEITPVLWYRRYFLTEAQPTNRQINDIDIFINYNWVDTLWQ